MTYLLKVIVVYMLAFGTPSSVGEGTAIEVYEDGVLRAVGETNSISEHTFTLPYGRYIVGVWDKRFFPCGAEVKLDSDEESIVIRCVPRNVMRLPLVEKERK